jgi:alkyldihydroxyacetonephosphate synthase
MPALIPFVEEMLDIKLDIRDIKPECVDKPVPEPMINQDFYQAIEQAFSKSQYSIDKRERLIHSHGQSTADELYKVFYTRLERLVDMVFYPETEQDAVTLVNLAQQHNVCLVPYGGGTNVSCALKLPLSEKRMIVSVDMRRMNKIEWIDKENFRACVQAGITGKDLEELLAKEGFTSGHEPDSLELSTLGGWIATNASGMKRNRYGNIEEIVENMTMITPQGVLQQVDSLPRLSMGMQPQWLLFGSEGNLGLITKAVIKIHKQPEVTKYGSLVFRDFKTGCDFLYNLVRIGVIPASVRLMDNVQFRFGAALKPRPALAASLMSKLEKFFLKDIKGLDLYQIAVATLVLEGTVEEVKYQRKQVFKLARKYGGISGGEGNGKRGYMLTYAIAYLRDFLADFYIIGETYETTVPWSKIQDVCQAVAEEALKKHQQYNLPGRPYISPRVTQLYHTGVCIYFTHGFYTKGVERPDEIMSDIDYSLRQTIMSAGGSISHHHGVGKLRQAFMSQTISPASIELLKKIKQANDPQNIFGIRNNIFAE